MKQLLTTKLLTLLFVIALQQLNLSIAQTTPPIAIPQPSNSDPAIDADFYLDKAAVKVAELQTFVQSLQNKTELRQYPFRPVFFSKRDVGQARQTLELAKTQIDLISDRLKAERIQRYRRLLKRVGRLDKYLTIIRTDLLNALSPKSFPDLKADADRFRGIGMMLANLDSFESDPELAAMIVTQLPAAEQEVNRIATKYDLLIQQETIAGLQLAGLKRYFESKRKSFEAIAKQHQQSLPEQIKTKLTRAERTLLSQNQQRLSASQNDNVTQKLDELHNQLRNIKADLNLLEAIDPQSVQASLVLRKELSELLISAKKVEPADRYAGDDRAELIQVMSLLDAELDLESIRIPDKTWTRRTYWQFDGVQWLAIDHSVLEVYLLVKDLGEASANWKRFLLTKDHLNNDAISAKRDAWFR